MQREDRTGSPRRSNTPHPSHQKLSILGRVTALALLGQGLVYLFQCLFLWLLVGTFLLPVLAFSLVTLLASSLFLARLQWAALFGVFVDLVTSAVMLAVPETTTSLLHPAADAGHFGTLVILFAFALTALVAGIATIRENAYHSAQALPLWLRSFFWGLSGLVVGMIVVAALVELHPPSVAPNSITNGIPTVQMVGSHFSTNVVLVPKGATLQLVNEDATEHLIQNGYWTSNGFPHPQREPGAPIVQNLKIANGSVTIGPFVTSGVFHFYCTIHRGMNLTVVVQ